MDFLYDYSWPVPFAFREVLEQRKLSPGDVFYDHRDAYLKPWGEALRSVNAAIQVVSVTPFSLRVSVFQPNADRTALVPVREEFLTYEELFARLGRT